MNILSLLDILEDEMEKGKDIPFTQLSLIAKEKCLDLVRDIRLNLPEELKQAEWIKKERQRILTEAQNEANLMLSDTDVKIKALVEEDEITLKAQQHSKELLEAAQRDAKEVRVSARLYADELLSEIEIYIKNQLDIVKSNRQELNVNKKQ